MNKNDRILICMILIVIIIAASYLIYKIKLKPKYDQGLYDQIYAEYNEMLDNIEKREDNEDTIYMSESSYGVCRVAGEINIPKIKVHYPIVFETSDEYLKIAPAKFFGPNINQVGNVCIVGHNYKNNDFFSNLSKLEVNDKVYLMSNKGVQMSYAVYSKYEVDETDLRCTNQETNGQIEVTLITCTKDKNKRLVVKCRAIV